MKLCRFLTPSGSSSTGLLLNPQTILDLAPAGIPTLTHLLEHSNPRDLLRTLTRRPQSTHPLSAVRLLPPVDHQEIWAAGVTYLRSRKARTAESKSDASAYDRVYSALRPELFFKSMPHKAVGPGAAVGIRSDATWNVPEPELALVFNSRGQFVGATIGNDMSSRDIEGENLLYLPQAKIYNRSCALGPWITMERSESQLRRGRVTLLIRRTGRTIFKGETPLQNLQRTFDDLKSHLFRSQDFPHGVVLLTGTGIVPPNNFTLEPRDVVRISITGLGTLENTVETV